VDVEAVERVEAELDSFILKRVREREDEPRIEEAWAESARRHAEKLRQDNEAAWYAFHLSQAERIERTAAQLAADHRARAEALAEEPGRGGA
jgi:hypothetical protein